MTHAKGFQSHMDQHETIGELVKNVIAVIVAALAGWLGRGLTTVSRKEFDALVTELALTKAQSVSNGTEMATLKVSLGALERRIDEGFMVIREDIHRGKEHG